MSLSPDRLHKGTDVGEGPIRVLLQLVLLLLNGGFIHDDSSLLLGPPSLFPFQLIGHPLQELFNLLLLTDKYLAGLLQ